MSREAHLNKLYQEILDLQKRSKDISEKIAEVQEVSQPGLSAETAGLVKKLGEKLAADNSALEAELERKQAEYAETRIQQLAEEVGVDTDV